jgi:hypothetical protein
VFYYLTIRAPAGRGPPNGYHQYRLAA